MRKARTENWDTSGYDLEEALLDRVPEFCEVLAEDDDYGEGYLLASCTGSDAGWLCDVGSLRN